MERSDYCFIVSATQTYLPELTVCLNSLDHVGNKQDVHIIGIELEDSFLSQLGKLSYNVIHHNVTQEEWEAQGGRSEIVCRKRYWYAYEFGKDYKATCVLDADLVWVRDPIQYFIIAEKTGFCLGPSKEQNKVYDDPHHQFYGEWLIPEGYYNRKDVCNCPLFLDANVWKDALQKQWEWFIEGRPDDNFKAPDMDALNIALIKYGGPDKVVVLTGISWLGTNEQLLKPYMRAVNDRNLIKTECGFPIYSFHGQYYKRRWRQVQLSNRHHCAEGYLKASENCDNIASSAMDLLYNYFRQMLDHKIQIEKKNYVHPGEPYEE